MRHSFDVGVDFFKSSCRWFAILFLIAIKLFSSSDMKGVYSSGDYHIQVLVQWEWEQVQEAPPEFEGVGPPIKDDASPTAPPITEALLVNAGFGANRLRSMPLGSGSTTAGPAPAMAS
jgi:hypothetical protein